MTRHDDDLVTERTLCEALGRLPRHDLSAAQRRRLMAITDRTAPRRVLPWPELRTWPRVSEIAAVLAVAAALAVWSPWSRTATPGHSDAEIARASEQARTAVLLTAEAIAVAEKTTISDVLGSRLPRTLRKSLDMNATPSRGGEG